MEFWQATLIVATIARLAAVKHEWRQTIGGCA